jgi:hypothetical protein
MSTIDLKLKTYEQLQFEVMRLKTDNYLKQQELDQYKNNWEELKKYIGKEWYCFDNESLEFEIAKSILNKMKELEENN